MANRWGSCWRDEETWWGDFSWLSFLCYFIFGARWLRCTEVSVRSKKCCCFSSKRAKYILGAKANRHAIQVKSKNLPVHVINSSSNQNWWIQNNLLSPENENIPKTGYNYTPKVRGLVLTWKFGRPRSQRYIYRLQKRFCITSGKNTQQNHTVAIWATHDLLSTDGRFAKIPHWRLIPYGALIGLGSFGDEDAHCRTGFKFR